jgi:hypothetical protein
MATILQLHQQLRITLSIRHQADIHNLCLVTRRRMARRIMITATVIHHRMEHIHRLIITRRRQGILDLLRHIMATDRLRRHGGMIVIEGIEVLGNERTAKTTAIVDEAVVKARKQVKRVPEAVVVAGVNESGLMMMRILTTRRIHN